MTFSERSTNLKARLGEQSELRTIVQSPYDDIVIAKAQSKRAASRQLQSRSTQS